MSYVKVTVVDLEGNTHKAEVDPRASLDSIARDLAEELELSPASDYKIRFSGRIREGSILTLDPRKSKSARLIRGR
jgi:hypothetical protein